MHYFVKYDLFLKTYYAGPYSLDEVHSHEQDIAGYSGISDVSIKEAALFYKLKEPLGFCSNFWRAKMFVDGKWWGTVEHLYQAAKTSDAKEHELIWQAEKPREARNLGQTVKLKPNWDEIKYAVMKQCLMIKFTQHHDLLQRLLDTGDKVLVEDSDIDYYWGWGATRTGQNMLGKALMEVRKELSDYHG